MEDLKPSHLYFFRVQALNEAGITGEFVGTRVKTACKLGNCDLSASFPGFLGLMKSFHETCLSSFRWVLQNGLVGVILWPQRPGKNQGVSKDPRVSDGPSDGSLDQFWLPKIPRRVAKTQVWIIFVFGFPICRPLDRRSQNLLHSAMSGPW